MSDGRVFCMGCEEWLSADDFVDHGCTHEALKAYYEGRYKTLSEVREEIRKKKERQT